MSVEDIKSIPVSSIADDGAVLFLWATYPNLREALEVVKAWGFEYKTVAFTWVKTSTKKNVPIIGCGYWTRANAEICLLATKGKNYPRRVNAGVRQLVVAPQMKHSAKPVEVRERIVELLGDLPRIELFARERCEGWDYLGLDLDNTDIRVSLPMVAEGRWRFEEDNKEGLLQNLG